MGSHATIYAAVALAVALACLFAGFFWGRSNVKAQIERAVEKEHIALDSREFAMRTQVEDAVAEVARLRPMAEELTRVQKRLEREQAKYQQMKAEFNASMGIASAEGSESVTPAQPAMTPESADEAIQKLLQSLEVFNDPNAPAVLEELPAPQIPAAPPSTPPVSTPIPVVATPAPAPAPPRAAAATPVLQPASPESPRPAPSVPLPAVTSPTPAIPQVAKPAVATPVVPNPVAAPPPVSKAPAAPPRTPPAEPRKAAAAAPPKPAQSEDEWQEFARQLEALTGKKK